MRGKPVTDGAEALLIISPEDVGERLDTLLAHKLESVSRSQVQRAIEQGTILVNDHPSKPSYKLREGDRILVLNIPRVPQGEVALIPSYVDLRVVYEDDKIIVIDKPAGMVVHPSPGHYDNTLVNALIARYPDLLKQPTDRPGIVHRLDKDTSGLIIVARDLDTLNYLQGQMKARKIFKEYTLLCCGALDPPEGRIEAPIGRDLRDRTKMSVIAGGKEAVTEYSTIQSLGKYTLAIARPITGRTHQIRVHFAAIGHPIAGDPIYGNCRLEGLNRQFLHASRLGVVMPNGEYKEWRRPLPEDLRQSLEKVTVLAS